MIDFSRSTYRTLAVKTTARLQVREKSTDGCELRPLCTKEKFRQITITCNSVAFV